MVRGNRNLNSLTWRGGWQWRWVEIATLAGFARGKKSTGRAVKIAELWCTARNQTTWMMHQHEAMRNTKKQKHLCRNPEKPAPWEVTRSWSYNWPAARSQMLMQLWLLNCDAPPWEMWSTNEAEKPKFWQASSQPWSLSWLQLVITLWRHSCPRWFVFEWLYDIPWRTFDALSLQKQFLQLLHCSNALKFQHRWICCITVVLCKSYL